jgi:hypothetical protein
VILKCLKGGAAVRRVRSQHDMEMSGKVDGVRVVYRFNKKKMENVFLLTSIIRMHGAQNAEPYANGFH